MLGDRAGLRYVLAGGFNTAATYLLYLACAHFMPYALAYTLAYVSGIAIGYFLNSVWVFRAAPAVRSAVLYPLLYILQYVLGLVLLSLLVEIMNLDKAIAVLLVILAMLPVTYLLTRKIFAAPRASEVKVAP